MTTATATAMSQQFKSAAARAITLLDAASQHLSEHSRRSEDLRDQVDLFGMSLLAFTAAGKARNLVSGVENDDEQAKPTDPERLVAEAHDILLEHTSAMDPAEVLGLVIEVGTVRQQLRHYVDRH